MRRRPAIWLVTSFVGAGLWAIVGLPSSAPLYGGKPVSQWLDDGYEQASMVVRELGPEAVPAIFRKVRWYDPAFGYWQKYRTLRDKMPAPVGGLLPKPKTGNFDAVRAGTLLAQTGPQAIPMLTTALKDHNPAVRAASAWALSSLAQSGKDIETALPLLTKALGDGNRSVRQNAATAIKANSIHPRGRVRRTGSGRAGAAINGRVETRPQRPPGPTC